MQKLNKKRGFTLLEILIVIAIIAILATIVLIAIDPAKRFREANNTSRQAHLNSLMDAIGLRIIDGKGSYLATTGACSTATADIPDTVAGEKFMKMPLGTDGYNIAECLVPNFMGVLPVDPKGDSTCTPQWTDATNYHTCYKIVKDATSGRITISAPAAEGNPAPVIQVTR